jgi:hypothetical protein
MTQSLQWHALSMELYECLWVKMLSLKHGPCHIRCSFHLCERDCVRMDTKQCDLGSQQAWFVKILHHITLKAEGRFFFSLWGKNRSLSFSDFQTTTKKSIHKLMKSSGVHVVAYEESHKRFGSPTMLPHP